MKKYLIVLILYFCFGTLAWADEGEKFCNDPKAWEHFNSMVEEYPTDIAVQILHALKIGLCQKIQNNSISPSEAIDLFNNMVDSAADLRGKEDASDGQDF